MRLHDYANPSIWQEFGFGVSCLEVNMWLRVSFKIAFQKNCRIQKVPTGALIINFILYNTRNFFNILTWLSLRYLLLLRVEVHITQCIQKSCLYSTNGL